MSRYARRRLAALLALPFLGVALALNVDAADLQPSDQDGSVPSAKAALDEPLRMTIVKLDLIKALELVSEQAHLKIVPSRGVGGTVANLQVDGTVATALDLIAQQVGAVWWWNGSEVRLASRADVGSRSIRLRDPQTLIQYADKIGLPTNLLTINRLPGQSMARVSGPTALVSDFEALSEQLSSQLGVITVYRYGKRRKQLLD